MEGQSMSVQAREARAPIRHAEVHGQVLVCGN